MPALHETMFTLNLFGTFVIAALGATTVTRNHLAARGQLPYAERR